MRDFSIKDKCDRCQGTDDLDGVICPYTNEEGQLVMDNATLCASCRIDLEKYLKAPNN